jgi:hypothetical protein
LIKSEDRRHRSPYSTARKTNWGSTKQAEIIAPHTTTIYMAMDIHINLFVKVHNR